ncbi:MAG: plasmid maintenance protein CcdB [Caulobacteraceae bacterium]|nr:plasmid maintenance protein CcdB [Caulobacteraceae bacterium]
MAVRQFDVFDNPSSAMREAAPFVVVLSSHLLPGLTEVVVAPLVRAGVLKPSDFDIPVVVDGENMVISIIGLAAIAGERLKSRRGSLLTNEDDIRRALDRLFTGF